MISALGNPEFINEHLSYLEAQVEALEELLSPLCIDADCEKSEGSDPCDPDAPATPNARSRAGIYERKLYSDLKRVSSVAQRLQRLRSNLED